MSIRVQKDLTQKWYDFPYVATNDTIDVVLDQWLAEWRATIDLVVGGSKPAAQRKKEEVKLKIT